MCAEVRTPDAPLIRLSTLIVDSRDFRDGLSVDGEFLSSLN